MAENQQGSPAPETAAPIDPEAPLPQAQADALAKQYGLDKAPVDLTHPDLSFTRSRGTNYFVFEFRNTVTGTGPHVARISVDKNADVKKQIGLFLLSHPHIQIDYAKGFKAHPHIFSAMQDSQERSIKYDASNPSRIRADQMFPAGEANRILEAGKPV